MKQIYRDLMIQYGGSIPFHILGGVQEKIRTKRLQTRVRKRKPKKTKQRTRHRLNPHKYAAGTIIRENGNLMKLSSTKQWINI